MRALISRDIITIVFGVVIVAICIHLIVLRQAVIELATLGAESAKGFLLLDERRQAEINELNKQVILLKKKLNE